MLPNKSKAQTIHKEAMVAIQNSAAQKAQKKEPGHHLHKIKGTETRLNQISQTNTKTTAGEKLTETTERP